MLNCQFLLVIVCASAATIGCKQNGGRPNRVTNKKEMPKLGTMCCESNIPKRFASLNGTNSTPEVLSVRDISSHKGMVYIKSGTFMMGGNNQQAADDEYPKHKVTVSGFWMDEHEVTNDCFHGAF